MNVECGIARGEGRGFAWGAALLMACVACPGCAEHLETAYGQREGLGASASVNGTAVLGEMLEQAGHKVFSWNALSPWLAERADCIVWFPDDFQPPSQAVREWLETWLYDKPRRTLIYVGRDFDAAVGYWEKVQIGAPAEQLPELRRRLASAREAFRHLREEQADTQKCPWFTIDGKLPPRHVRSLEGDPSWTRDIDPAKLEIELDSRMTARPTADVFLQSRRDMILSRDRWDTSQLILVANGSFLLNLPLVNHEHRKLAGKLIDQIGGPGQTVVFLESEPGGPPIRPADPAARAPSALAILLMSPTNWIFAHFAVVGSLLCFSRWPIFGLPRQLPPQSTSDFGAHVRALGELLQRSGDEAYAVSRLLHYQQGAGTKPQRHKE